jgi:cytochrome c oxidase subunit III
MQGEHAVAHHFDDAEQQRDAATLGMWVFISQEVMFFGGALTAYIFYRSWYPQAFAHASRELDVQLGAINTVVLIASSLTMALAVHGAQIGRRAQQLWGLALTMVQLLWGLALTMVFGTVFLGIKSYEYAHKFHEGLVPGPHFTYHGDAKEAQLFFSAYFALTGLHALHMIIGLGILTVLLVMAQRGRFGPHYYTPMELTGLYWHFVDIVWIFLFPLLYLIGRH